MYLTNFKVSAFALLFSMTLIFGAAHYAPTAADACVNCATLAPVPTLEAAPAASSDPDYAGLEAQDLVIRDTR